MYLDTWSLVNSEALTQMITIWYVLMAMGFVQCFIAMPIIADIAASRDYTDMPEDITLAKHITDTNYTDEWASLLDAPSHRLDTEYARTYIATINDWVNELPQFMLVGTDHCPVITDKEPPVQLHLVLAASRAARLSASIDLAISQINQADRTEGTLHPDGLCPC